MQLGPVAMESIAQCSHWAQRLERLCLVYIEFEKNAPENKFGPDTVKRIPMRVHTQHWRYWRYWQRKQQEAAALKQSKVWCLVQLRLTQLDLERGLQRPVARQVGEAAWQEWQEWLEWLEWQRSLVEMTVKQTHDWP